MIKIVYFDEFSATDYLNIYDGGEVIKTSEDIKKKNKDLAGKAGTTLASKLSWLPFVSADASLSANFEYSKVGSSLIKTTLANTVLTDFIAKAVEDEKIYKIKDFNLETYKNSIAFFKMFTPYLIITKSDITTDDGVVMDISKLDEAFKNGKGYYEMIANDTKKDYKCILRFNIHAFRNNYGIADLTKMNLTYFAVKVGSAYEETLDINKEFLMDEKEIITSIDNLKSKNDIKLDVFDVILAGVEI